MSCSLCRSSRPSYSSGNMSRKTAGNGRAVLEGVGLDAPTIATCFTANPQKEDEVQEGMIK